MNRLWISLILLLVALVGLGLWLRPAGTDSTVAETLDDEDLVELSRAKQKHIWEMEHATFQIERYFGKPVARALREGDTQTLLEFLRDEFEGQVFAPGQAATQTAAIVRESSRRGEGASREAVDGRGFVDYLFRGLASFERIDRTRFRVLQIDVEQAGHWTTELLYTASGVGAAGGPQAHESILVAEFVFDDGRQIEQGNVLARIEVVSETVRSSPRPLMEEVTERYGLAELGLLDNWELPLEESRNHRYQVAVEDFDRDGYLDVILGTTDGRPYLLRSIEGKRFEDVAGAFGLPAGDGEQSALNALVTWIDYDNDGFPDLILGGRLYHNENGERFADVSAGSRLKFNRVPLGAAVADFDADGLLDLYVVHQKSNDPLPPAKRGWVDDVDSGARNELWLNEGGGRFRNVTVPAGAGGGLRQSFAAAAFFYDDDRFPDLYVANDFGQNVLLRNRGDGTFEDLSNATRAADFATSMGVATGDLDNDGAADIYVANMYSKMGRRIIAHVEAADYPPGIFEQIEGSCAGNRLYRRPGGQGDYQESSADLGINGVGWAYAPAIVDLDGDGWLDLYATTGFMSFDREKPDG